MNTPAGTTAPRPTEDDLWHLDRATALGRRGWGRVHPNPLVGCVLVKRGRVVGEGWHEEFGVPHAEIRALERALTEARGATAYVSLEPCRHHGKTPPCALALREAGVVRVVFGAADPGAESGGGADELRAAGIEVVGPLASEREAFRENPAFFHEAWTGKAYVALKLALGLDGRITQRRGMRTVVSGADSLAEVQRLRAGHDAVLIGAGTARVDDPLLTVRASVPMRTPPTRVVLDPQATLSTEAALFRDIATVPLVVFVRENVPDEVVRRLEAAGATVHPVAGDADELDLVQVLEVCHRSGLRSLLCEGGAHLATSLLAGRLLSRMYLVFTPRTLGVEGVPAFRGTLATDAWSHWEPSVLPRVLGKDVLLTWDRLHMRDPHSASGGR